MFSLICKEAGWRVEGVNFWAQAQNDPLPAYKLSNSEYAAIYRSSTALYWNKQYPSTVLAVSGEKCAFQH